MNVNEITTQTSSRLNRESILSPAVEVQKEAIGNRTIAYCHESLARSRFDFLPDA